MRTVEERRLFIQMAVRLYEAKDTDYSFENLVEAVTKEWTDEVNEMVYRFTHGRADD